MVRHLWGTDAAPLSSHVRRWPSTTDHIELIASVRGAPAGWTDDEAIFERSFPPLGGYPRPIDGEHAHQPREEDFSNEPAKFMLLDVGLWRWHGQRG